MEFSPPFSDQLYFVYTGKKQKTQEAIDYYRKTPVEGREELVSQLSSLSREMVVARTLGDFEFFLKAHEKIISQALGLSRVGDDFFPDYWGEVKSLGAWGGDFVLATSERGEEQTRRYFKTKGFLCCLPYSEIVGEGSTCESPQ